VWGREGWRERVECLCGLIQYVFQLNTCLCRMLNDTYIDKLYPSQTTYHSLRITETLVNQH
jgi:hypothetical protein